MTYAWPKDLMPQSAMAAPYLPPPTVEETAWDILLALHSDRSRRLGLDKLARMVSVSRPTLNCWLALLEKRSLITGTMHDELRAVLTPAGRELLDLYWSATSGLQVGASH